MDNTFGQIANQMIADRSEQGSSPSNEQVSSNSSSQALSSEREQEVAQALAELDKMDKFKFQGQEWTPKDLEKAILRQKDYTQKTQSLSDERKSFGDERKFYENLAWDLMKLRDNPQMVQEFVKVYPQQFHQYAEQFLKQASNQVQQSGNQQGSQPQQSNADVQTLSRLERLEKFYNDQEVAKNELEIKNTMTTMATKYPDAANFTEMVLGRAYEAHTQGTKLTSQVWEDIYKQVNDQVGSMLKTKYGDLVKKQQAANVKARDVGAGGGTVGTAPKKFKGFKEATAAAIADLSGRE